MTSVTDTRECVFFPIMWSHMTTNPTSAESDLAKGSKKYEESERNTRNPTSIKLIETKSLSVHISPL